MKILLVILLGFILSGCAANKEIATYKGKAPFVEGTTTSDRLINLPDLDNQPIITIAVYRFTDQTGQRKPSTKFSQLSTAVTQGARYLGIGISEQYRVDQVTVAIRLVSVQTG